ncbi:hypothetical protein GE09DRAFT_770576 [Coniochaeta sp. 2T2.1]|nr:hypothetical protein GE09DRAFT_770576 [Coniochaeta sp. 2T2.1]
MATVPLSPSLNSYLHFNERKQKCRSNTRGLCLLCRTLHRFGDMHDSQGVFSVGEISCTCRRCTSSRFTPCLVTPRQRAARSRWISVSWTDNSLLRDSLTGKLSNPDGQGKPSNQEPTIFKVWQQGSPGSATRCSCIPVHPPKWLADPMSTSPCFRCGSLFAVQSDQQGGGNRSRPARPLGPRSDYLVLADPFSTSHFAR